MLELLILVVVVALIFDFINGFHDAANAIATSVSTGVMSVRTAVIVSGIFNFFGALAGTAVASFIAKGLADPALITQQVVLGALIGASTWNLMTWWWGLPSSSSHALVGGLAGAVVAHAGFEAFKWAALTKKVLIPLVASPIIGLITAFVLMILSLWIVRRMRPNTVNRGARYLQLVSACTLSFAHGSNDAQKAMGIITLALLSAMAAGTVLPGWAAPLPEAVIPPWAQPLHDITPSWLTWILPHATNIPTWVIISCALAMCLGTMAGGKKIIKTMGSKIIKINPLQGFAAQTSGTATILAASSMGIPVSTTHCITSSVMGAGATKGLAAVRWGTAVNILVAWVLTLPASAIVAWVCTVAMEFCFGK
jgi:PiT family inorganic phosphate transporter